MRAQTRVERRPPEVLPVVALVVALLLSITPRLLSGSVSSERPAPTTLIPMAEVPR